MRDARSRWVPRDRRCSSKWTDMMIGTSPRGRMRGGMTLLRGMGLALSVLLLGEEGVETMAVDRRAPLAVVLIAPSASADVSTSDLLRATAEVVEARTQFRVDPIEGA